MKQQFDSQHNFTIDNRMYYLFLNLNFLARKQKHFILKNILLCTIFNKNRIWILNYERQQP